ncbi:MAG: hypothetical protein ACKOXB_15760 [Flavobacteriales bacterium]
MEVIISVVITVGGFMFSVFQYFATKRQEQNHKEFENYHRLIKELVQPEEQGLYLDRQTTILYELRYFKRYYPISYRTVVGLKEKWEKVPDQFPRLIDECNRTIAFLEHQKSVTKERCVQVIKSK